MRAGDPRGAHRLLGQTVRSDGGETPSSSAARKTRSATSKIPLAFDWARAKEKPWLSSPALLTRMLDAGMRTVLIDEADRSLNPEKEGVFELLAVLNSGYKRGGTRPVLVPTNDGWTHEAVSETSDTEPETFTGEYVHAAPRRLSGHNPPVTEEGRPDGALLVRRHPTSRRMRT